MPSSAHGIDMRRPPANRAPSSASKGGSKGGAEPPPRQPRVPARGIPADASATPVRAPPGPTPARAVAGKLLRLSVVSLTDGEDDGEPVAPWRLPRPCAAPPRSALPVPLGDRRSCVRSDPTARRLPEMPLGCPETASEPGRGRWSFMNRLDQALCACSAARQILRPCSIRTRRRSKRSERA